MKNRQFYFLLLFHNALFFLISESFGQASYYTNANINFKKNYYQVPTDEIIFAKIQAGEPNFFYKGPYKGKGRSEALFDKIILALRKENIRTYVDYFTGAKVHDFYDLNPLYTVCSTNGTIYSDYKQNKNKHDFVIPDKYSHLAIPHSVRTPIMHFAIRTDKIPEIKEYQYPHSSVYSVKGIIHNPNLYTVYQMGSYSPISKYIFGVNSFTSNLSMPPEFKKRVYQLVASDAIQMIMMLRGNRMHYVDMTQYFDYHINLLNIGKDVMQLLEYSHKDPKDFTDDDLRVSMFNCTGPLKNKKLIINTIKIINKEVKKYRTNVDFISTSFEKYLKDTNQKIINYKDYPLYKLGLDYMKRLENGEFD